MTKFSTNGAGSHEAGSLRVSRSGSATERAYVFRAFGVDMFSRLALEVLHLARIRTSVDSKASLRWTKRFSEESDTKGCTA